MKKRKKNEIIGNGEAHLTAPIGFHYKVRFYSSAIAKTLKTLLKQILKLPDLLKYKLFF